MTDPQKMNEKGKQTVKQLTYLVKAEAAENTEPPTLADYNSKHIITKSTGGKISYSQSFYNLKNAANMLNFLQQNQIMDMAGLNEKFKSMIGDSLIFGIS